MFPCTTLPYRGSLPIKPKVPILKRPAGTHPFRSDHLEIAKARAASRAHSQGCLVGRSTTGRGGAGDKNGRSDDDDCYSEGAADRPTWCIEVPLKGGWYMFGQLPTREPVAPSNLRRTSSPAPLDYADVSTPRTPRGLLRSNSSVRSSPQFGRRARAESAERQGSLEKSGRMKNNVEKTHMLRHAGDAQKDGARPYQGPGKITPRTPQAVKTEAVVKPAPTAFDYHMQLVRAQLPTQGTRLPSVPGPGTAVAGSNVESAARAANCDASSDTSEEPWRWQRFEGGWRWERKNHKPKSILQYGNFPVKSSNNNQNFE